jgi:hypothetical protein
MIHNITMQLPALPSFIQIRSQDWQEETTKIDLFFIFHLISIWFFFFYKIFIFMCFRFNGVRFSLSFTVSEITSIKRYRVVSPRILFASRVVSSLFPFAPGRFAPIPVRPGSFRPHLLIVL